MAWGLWNSRNKIKHGDQCKIAATIVNEASWYLEEFQQAQAPNIPKHARSQA